MEELKQLAATVSKCPLLLVNGMSALQAAYILYTFLLSKAKASKMSFISSWFAGLSLFDGQAKVYVIIRGEFAVEAGGLLDGALLMLLSFFVFNIKYPKRLSRTLEFLQR